MIVRFRYYMPILYRIFSVSVDVDQLNQIFDLSNPIRTYKGRYQMQVTATTCLNHAVLGPQAQVAKWPQQYYALVVPSGLLLSSK